MQLPIRDNAMIEDGAVMTRRFALGGSVLAGVTAFSGPGASARHSSNVVPAVDSLVSRLRGELRGEDLEGLSDLMHVSVRTIAWTGSVELDVVGAAAYHERYLAPYLRSNPDFKMTITKVLTNGIDVVAFYVSSATVDGKPSTWCGCNLYITDGERLIEHWIEQDLWWRSRRSPSANFQIMLEQLERVFRPQTTAANLAGMGRFVSYKNTIMSSSRRIAGFVDFLAPDAVQTSWEPEGVIFLPNPKTIAAKFEDGLLRAIPDFWETVRRVVIVGNMLVLTQVPSGGLVVSSNNTKYCAWYNCDIFFFEDDCIKYVLFQRDVMYDLSQTSA
jgi:hypothetical protein